MLVLLISGLPIAFGLGSVGLIFGFLFVGPEVLGVAITSLKGIMNNFNLSAIPMFIFMAFMLESSGLVDAMYTMMQNWMGPLKGGLAIGTVLICTVIAAMSGVSAAGTVSMGLIALPAMLKRGYDKSISLGCIAAAGGLGQLIPPSSIMIVYCLFAGGSIGRMFIAGIIPGLLLSALFCIYIGVRCYLQPKLGPVMPREDRADWGERFVSLKAVILPILLVIGVLGSIFFGVATASQSAAIGAFGSILCACIYRRLSWPSLNSALLGTIKISCMILWTMLGGTIFANILNAIGAQQFVIGMVQSWQISPWFIIIICQIVWLILGMFLDGMGIMFLTIPVFLPIVLPLGFDPLWFGILFIMNMEMGLITPPFGVNLFYLKGVTPKNITMIDLYRSIVPFVGLQIVGLVICMIFPQVILWLPNLVMGVE